MTLAVFLLAGGAAARLTRFVTADYLAAGFRMWAARRFGGDSKLAYLVECPWCAGMYVFAVVYAAAWALTGRTHRLADLFLWPAAALTAGWLYGLVAENLDGDE